LIVLNSKKNYLNQSQEVQEVHLKINQIKKIVSKTKTQTKSMKDNWWMNKAIPHFQTYKVKILVQWNRSMKLQKNKINLIKKLLTN